MDGSFFFLMVEWYSIMYSHHLLVQSSIDEYLACFYIWVIVFIAALFIRGQITFNVLFSLPLDICPEVGLMDHLVVDFFTFFSGTSIRFFILIEPIYIYTKVSFLYIFANTCFLNDGHSNRSEDISIFLICISLVISGFVHLFVYLLAF